MVQFFMPPTPPGDPAEEQAYSAARRLVELETKSKTSNRRVFRVEFVHAMGDRLVAKVNGKLDSADSPSGRIAAIFEQSDGECFYAYMPPQGVYAITASAVRTVEDFDA
jgi:hypothetical protein